jgi:hypothetical protein
VRGVDISSTVFASSRVMPRWSPSLFRCGALLSRCFFEEPPDAMPERKRPVPIKVPSLEPGLRA